MHVRTTIVLDDELGEGAFRHAPVKTKLGPVGLALREFEAARRRRDVRDLIGKIGFDPNYPPDRA